MHSTPSTPIDIAVLLLLVVNTAVAWFSRPAPGRHLGASAIYLLAAGFYAISGQPVYAVIVFSFAAIVTAYTIRTVRSRRRTTHTPHEH